MCYCGKSADSKWFAPEIRRSAAQIISKIANDDNTYSSAVTGVPEMCYRGKSDDSKWFAPEIRGSAAQIRSKIAINDKRRGTSQAEPRDGPSRRPLSRVARVTHRVTLTPPDVSHL